MHLEVASMGRGRSESNFVPISLGIEQCLSLLSESFRTVVDTPASTWNEVNLNIHPDFEFVY
jgi:hypothetical protein